MENTREGRQVVKIGNIKIEEGLHTGMILIKENLDSEKTSSAEGPSPVNRKLYPSQT